MDINNYSYTGNGFADDGIIIKEYEHYSPEDDTPVFKVSLTRDYNVLYVSFTSLLGDKEDKYDEFGVLQVKKAVQLYNSYLTDYLDKGTADKLFCTKEEAREGIRNYIIADFITDLDVNKFIPSETDSNVREGDVYFAYSKYHVYVNSQSEVSPEDQIAEQIFETYSEKYANMYEFQYAFQLDKLRIFEVSYCTSGSNKAPHFSTHACEFMRSKIDYNRGGQCQPDICTGPALDFYQKWDFMHLKTIRDEEQFNEIIADIESLKKFYNFVEHTADFHVKDISFEENRHLSKMRMKTVQND